MGPADTSCLTRAFCTNPVLPAFKFSCSWEGTLAAGTEQLRPRWTPELPLFNSAAPEEPPQLWGVNKIMNLTTKITVWKHLEGRSWAKPCWEASTYFTPLTALKTNDWLNLQFMASFSLATTGFPVEPREIANPQQGACTAISSGKRNSGVVHK